MADRSNDPHALHGVALALLLLGLLLFYGWAWFPTTLQAQAWNAAGALARLALLGGVLYLLRGRMRILRFGSFRLGRFTVAVAAKPVLLVAAWWAAEDLMVAGCSVAFMVAPWQVPPGQAQCSALVQFDIGQIGLVVVAALLLLHPARSCSYER